MIPAVDPAPLHDGQSERLDSWKEIASYLSRGVTTVQRWERDEGLPVHRQQHDALGSVYAYKHELEVWRTQRAAPSGTEPSVVAAAPVPPVLPTSHPDPWILGMLPGLGLFIAAAALGALGVWMMTSDPPGRIRRLTIAPSTAARLVLNGTDRSLVITPDGTRVVYVGGTGGSRLFVRALNQFEDTPIAGVGSPRHPFISPDGRWIGFFDGNVLKKVPITGGPPTTLTYRNSDAIREAIAGPKSALSDTQPRSGSRGATWGPDNTIAFAMDGHLLRIPADGGDVEMLSSPDPEKREAAYCWPEYLPGGEGLLFTIVPAGDWSQTGSGGAIANAEVAVLDMKTKKKKVLLQGGSHARYIASGHLVYASGGMVKAVAFDLKTLTISGPTRTVVPNVAMSVRGAADFDVAHDGTLIYAPGGADNNLVTLTWVDRHGVEEPLKAPAFVYRHPRLSPDGRRVAVGSIRDLGMLDIANSTLVWFAVGPASYPVWTPDGQRILFGSIHSAKAEIKSQPIDGSQPATRISESAHSQLPTSLSPDGTQLLLREDTSSTDLMVLHLPKDRIAQPLIHTSFGEQNAQFSPDGKFVMYQSNESGQDEIYVQPFPNVGGKRWIVSSNGGTQPAWAHNMEEIFYISPDNAMMSAKVEQRAPGFATAPPTELFKGPYYFGDGAIAGRAYDISPIDDRFLMLKYSGTAHHLDDGGHIEVVLNWFEELKQLAH